MEGDLYACGLVLGEICTPGGSRFGRFVPLGGLDLGDFHERRYRTVSVRAPEVDNNIHSIVCPCWLECILHFNACIPNNTHVIPFSDLETHQNLTFWYTKIILLILYRWN